MEVHLPYPHLGFHQPGSPTDSAICRSFLITQVAVVITTGLKREEGGPRADIVVLHVCRSGRSCDLGVGLRLVLVGLRLVFGGGTSHKPQMPGALRDAPQEEAPKAKGPVQVRRLGTRGDAPHFHSLAKNASTARLNSPGFSRVSQWPHCGKMRNSESFINVCARCAHETGTYLSSAPWRISVGTARV